MSTRRYDISEDLPLQITESLNAPAMLIDMQGKIAYVNDGMLRLIGIPRQQVTGQYFPYPWLLPQGPLSSIPWANAGEDATEVSQVEGLVTDATGSGHNISFNVSLLPDAGGRTKWLLSIGRENTPSGDTCANNCIAESLLVQAIKQIPEWVDISGLDGIIEVVNESGCAILGYTRDELEVKTWPYQWFEDGRPDVRFDASEQLQQSRETLEFEATCLDRSGDPKRLVISLSPMLGNPGEPESALMVSHDMTEHKEWNMRDSCWPRRLER